MSDNTNLYRIARLLESADCQEDFYACFGDEIFSAVLDEEETTTHKYAHFLNTYLNASPEERAIMDDTCIAFTGWRVSTLLENALAVFAVDHTLPEIDVNIPDLDPSVAPHATLSHLIQTARQQLQQKRPGERLQYDMADTLITYGDSGGGVHNLTLCITNPVGVDPMSYNANTVMTSGTDGKAAVLKRHEARLDLLNRMLEKDAQVHETYDPLSEL